MKPYHEQCSEWQHRWVIRIHSVELVLEKLDKLKLSADETQIKVSLADCKVEGNVSWPVYQHCTVCGATKYALGRKSMVRKQSLISVIFFTE